VAARVHAPGSHPKLVKISEPYVPERERGGNCIMSEPYVPERERERERWKLHHEELLNF